MKLKNSKGKEYIVIAFICISDKKEFKILDIRDLKDYILTNDS